MANFPRVFLAAPFGACGDNPCQKRRQGTGKSLPGEAVLCRRMLSHPPLRLQENPCQERRFLRLLQGETLANFPREFLGAPSGAHRKIYAKRGIFRYDRDAVIHAVRRRGNPQGLGSGTLDREPLQAYPPVAPSRWSLEQGFCRAHPWGWEYPAVRTGVCSPRDPRIPSGFA